MALVILYVAVSVMAEGEPTVNCSMSCDWTAISVGPENNLEASIGDKLLIISFGLDFTTTGPTTGPPLPDLNRTLNTTINQPVLIGTDIFGGTLATMQSGIVPTGIPNMYLGMVAVEAGNFVQFTLNGTVYNPSTKSTVDWTVDPKISVVAPS
jgi:hypothetical protein